MVGVGCSVLPGGPGLGSLATARDLTVLLVRVGVEAMRSGETRS